MTVLPQSAGTEPALLSLVCRKLAASGLVIAVIGLLVIIGIVAWQVFGRYVLNDSPTWTENLAMVMVLYVTLIGAAVGVRDAGHIGMDSLLSLVPEEPRRYVSMLIHVLVAGFGVAMAWNGTILGIAVAPYKLANLNLSEASRYVPLILSGLLIVLFSIEHLIALITRTSVEPTWR
jgi:TRAP-type C4-dicarboxylate transport system permease small subunit